MPKGERGQLPRCLSRQQLIAALRAAGADKVRTGGDHPDIWRLQRPDGSVRTFPVGNYPEFGRKLIRMTFLNEMGLTKTQMMAAINGRKPWPATSPRSATTPGSADGPPVL